MTVKLVAGEAALIRFFRWSDRELEEFRLVATGLHMGLPGAVAVFAGSGTGSIFLPLQFHFPMWVCMEPFGLWHMAKPAGLGPHKAAGGRGQHGFLRWSECGSRL
jgi:hypothetical protein